MHILMAYLQARWHILVMSAPLKPYTLQEPSGRHPLRQLDLGNLVFLHGLRILAPFPLPLDVLNIFLMISSVIASTSVAAQILLSESPATVFRSRSQNHSLIPRLRRHYLLCNPRRCHLVIILLSCIWVSNPTHFSKHDPIRADLVDPS